MPGPSYDRILVTGGSGFLGRHVLNSLLKDGQTPLTTSRDPDFEKSSSIDVVNLDLTDATKTSRFIESYRPQIVIHLAGVTSHTEQTERLCDEVNFIATTNLLNVLMTTDVARVILIGSAAEYGDQPIPFREDMPARPVSTYGVSKAKATEFALHSFETRGLPVTILRLFSVWGLGQPANMFLSQLITHGLLNRHFTMSSGLQKRDFVYIKDVVSAIRRSITAAQAVGRVINIGSGRGTTLKEVAKSVWNLCGADPYFLDIGARERSHADRIDTEANISLARELLDWEPNYHIIDAPSHRPSPLSDVIAATKAQFGSKGDSPASKPSDTP